ncbi:MAG TPA: efflux RND transporter periplasmic adaptor subunit [Steroidobacteraceae bacterium]|nr:efflux RND transporter periplasmic adaptor subunit [Steroidobacteraceae bacterium]
MDDKTSLLEQLRIDRGDEARVARPPIVARRNWTVWLGAGLLLLVLAGAGAWYFLRPAAIPVRVAVARPLATASNRSVGGVSMLDASGYVVARREATVSAKTTLRVLEVLIEEGQKVEEGQVIARLDDSNTRATLEQAKAAVAQADANTQAAKIALDDARPIYQRMEQQRAASVISAQDFDTAKATYNAAESNYLIQQRALEAARANLMVAQRIQDDTIVRAPFTGIVTDKAAQPGEIVSPVSAGGGYTRTGICTIVDMDSLEADVDVSENFINRVHPGQAATVRLNAYPDWEIPAQVLAIIPTADRSKATVKVRVGFKQKDARILPEMGARVAFLTDATPSSGSGSETASSATLIPSDAVQANGDTGTVFVVDGTRVERRSVKLGSRTSEGQMVLSGLSPGTRVAVGDLSRLADHTRISISDQSQTSSE